MEFLLSNLELGGSGMNLRIKVESEERTLDPQLKYLNSLRDYIDKIPIKDWKRIRWFVNYYDFIVKDPIINRAFYKYWEIVKKYNLLDSVNNVLHLAEAPGGFIQGTNVIMKKRNVKPKKLKSVDGFEMFIKQPKNDWLIFTMSLDIKNPKYVKYNLPSYNLDVLKSNVYTCYGKTGTGDICNLDNFEYLKNDLAKRDILLVDFITGDGGLDEKNDYNNKERYHYRLIFYELYYGINLQKENGSFLIKFFDIFTYLSIEFLYLLSIHYEEVYIYKPHTSRPTNSEKYIVCKRFKGVSKCMRDYLTHIHDIINDFDFKNGSLSIVELPKCFYDGVMECNKKLVKIQCEYLERALSVNDVIYRKNLKETRDLKLKRYNEWRKEFDFIY